MSRTIGYGSFGFLTTHYEVEEDRTEDNTTAPHSKMKLIPHTFFIFLLLGEKKALSFVPGAASVMIDFACD